MNRISWRRHGQFLLLAAPVLALRLSTAGVPLGDSLRMSVTNEDLLDPASGNFVGLDNFRELLTDPVFRGVLYFTLLFVLVSTFLEIVVGLLLALLLNATFRGRFIARTINLIPWAIPTIVAAYTFKWLLDDQSGPLSETYFDLFGARLAVFNSVWGARAALIAVNVWKNAPFIAIVLLAGLQGVPDEIYEAASTDGAGGFLQFRKITLPMLMPLLVTMSMYMVVWQLASFDLVYGLTEGKPGTATSVLAYEVFRLGITQQDFGMASAVSVLLIVMVAITAAMGVLFVRRCEY